MFYWCTVYLSIVGVSGVVLNTAIIALYWGNKKVGISIYFNYFNLFIYKTIREIVAYFLEVFQKIAAYFPYV